MDNFDTESNHSYQSDSLQSNASSVSGLSLYGNEFAELRHLVNPYKYPTPYLDRSSTPKAELTCFQNVEVDTLKVNLQRSLELNEKYKNDLLNVEKQIELKFYDKIDKILRNNTRLEGELENANNQIERIIKNYKEKSELLAAKENFELEKKLHQCSSTNSTLQIQCVNLKHENVELDLENKNLKISLGELLIDREVKNVSIQNLKLKISEQHIELQNGKKNNDVLLNKLNVLSTKLEQSEKSKDWYKNELYQCQNNVQTSKEEMLKDKNQITLLNQKVSSLNIEISKYKNGIDQVRLQALREKEELFKKLENININYNALNKLPLLADSKGGNTFNNVSFYELTIEDLKEELSRTKLNSQEKEEEFDNLKQENCDLIAKYLVLQKSLQQNENSIELLESSKKELVRKLEHLKESEKVKLQENLELRNKITELEVELNNRDQEKQSVEHSIRVIREQFLKFKEHHEKVKNEVNLKNKEILQLQQEKQELFMNNNWTICELEKLKEKDFLIEKLKQNIVNLENHIKEQTQKIRDLEFQILKNDKIVTENENIISEKIQELKNHNMVIVQYKELLSDYENKITKQHNMFENVESERNELEENYKTVKEELKKKDLKLDKTLKGLEQLKNDHKNALQSMSTENSRMLEYHKDLVEKYNCKLKENDAYITDLHDKLTKLESDCEKYVKRITDDQKVEMLLNHKIAYQDNGVDFRNDFTGCKVLKNTFNSHLLPYNLEKMIMNFFDNLNMEELESTVEIRLKYLDEKLQKVKANCEGKIEKLRIQYGIEKIKELEILLQVKDRDMKEKQNKMDKNNRTLLRKIKEHMRGRNSAEKELKYLQDLYNFLCDELNTAKLSVSSKEYEIESLEKLCANYKYEVDKLKNNVLHLQKELSRNKMCEKCLEVDELNEKLLILQEIQEMNNQLKDKVKSSEGSVLQLTNKVKEQEIHAKSSQEKISSLIITIEKYASSLTELENKYSSQSSLVKELSEKLTEKEKNCITSYTTIDGLSKVLEQENEKNRWLSTEIKILSSDLQQKVEYIEELQRNKTELENEFGSKNKENQNLVADFRNKLVLLQNEMKNLKSDKFFLQRLSNDLKTALQSYVENNKNLKEQVNLLAKEKQPFSSLPPNILDGIAISGKYDEKYINQLLEENNAPMKNPLTSEIHDCLSKLREEIFSLQDEIVKKNTATN